MRGTTLERHGKGCPKNDNFTLALSLSHTHTRAHTHTHKYTLSLSLSLSLTHTHTHTLCVGHHPKGTPRAAQKMTISHSPSLTHSVSLPLSHTHTYCAWGNIGGTRQRLSEKRPIHTLSLSNTHTLSLSLTHTHTQIMRGATSEGHGKGCPPGCGCNPSSNFSQGLFSMGLFYGSLSWVSFHMYRSLLMHKAVLLQISLKVCIWRVSLCRSPLQVSFVDLFYRSLCTCDFDAQGNTSSNFSQSMYLMGLFYRSPLQASFVSKFSQGIYLMGLFYRSLYKHLVQISFLGLFPYVPLTHRAILLHKILKGLYLRGLLYWSLL